MTVTTKKYKLFKVCKELNVGLDTLSSFLEEKGVKVKGPNTAFPEEIYIEILTHFAKDKELADIIQKRRKLQEGTISEAGVESTEEEVPKKKPAYVEIIEKSIEEGVVDLAKSEQAEKEEKAKAKKEKEDKKVGKKKDLEEVEQKEETPSPKKKETEEEKSEEKIEKEETKPEKEIKDSRILGHIDIDSIQGKKKPPPKKEES